jgi:hypothetical protein
MSKRILALAIVALVVAACGGSPTNEPGSTPTPGAEATPTAGETATDGGQPTTPPNTGDLKAKGQALLPPDAQQTTEVTAGGVYQVYATSGTSLADLKAFWEQKIPSLGMTLTGTTSSEGSLIIAFTNPDGGIVAGTDTSTGDTTLVISLGTSS